ncbi:MAG TPA: hypothetical protein VKP64_14280 [Mycobacteriales bacterium]|nr:hypothetical protein [Mycobacteriales bacterium]
MSRGHDLVPLHRAPARRARLPVAVLRRALRDPRASALAAAAVTLGAQRGLRALTSGGLRRAALPASSSLPIGRLAARRRGTRLPAAGEVPRDGWVEVWRASYVVQRIRR